MPLRPVKLALVLLLQAVVVLAQAPSPVGIQAALSKRIPALQIALDEAASHTSPFLLLAAKARIPMGIEMMPLAQEDSRLRSRQAGPSIMLRGESPVADALQQIAQLMPSYRVATDDGLINVAPADVISAPTHFLNQELPSFDVRDVPIKDAIVALLREIKRSSASGPWDSFYRVDGSDPRLALTRALLARHVTLSAKGISPRQALNRLIAQHGELIWEVSYEAPPYRRSARKLCGILA